MNSRYLINRALDGIAEGMVFNYADLNLPGEYYLSAAQAISRMVKSSQLRKIGKGKFYKPKFSRLGEVPPMIEGMMKDLLFQDGKRTGYITGVPAFLQMGLTTQISSKILIASNDYRRPLKRAGYEIAFTRQDNDITDDNVPLLQLLDAIKFIKQIPATTPDDVITQVKEILRTLTREKVIKLECYAMNYPASTRALFGATMEDALGSPSKLKDTLNPFTKYKIGISERVLPNKKSWNIS